MKNLALLSNKLKVIYKLNFVYVFFCIPIGENLNF